MSNRSVFWYGLGIGLIIGVVLLEMMTLSVPKTQGIETASIDESKIKDLAEKNGYKLVAKSENLYTEQQVNDRVKQTLEAKKPDSQPVSPIPAPNPVSTSTPAATASAGKQQLYIYISEGNSSSDISVMLAKAGLIASAASFEEKLRNRKIDTKINRGPFMLSPEMSEEDIISKIMIYSP